jgi:Inositol monophosphatase family
VVCEHANTAMGGRRLTAHAVPQLSPTHRRCRRCRAQAWDVAAGALLILEAGGAMTHCDGSAYSLPVRSILGSNGRPLHAEIVEVLVAAEATVPDKEPRVGV